MYTRSGPLNSLRVVNSNTRLWDYTTKFWAVFNRFKHVHDRARDDFARRRQTHDQHRMHQSEIDVNSVDDREIEMQHLDSESNNEDEIDSEYVNECDTSTDSTQHFSLDSDDEQPLCEANSSNDDESLSDHDAPEIYLNTVSHHRNGSFIDYLQELRRRTLK